MKKTVGILLVLVIAVAVTVSARTGTVQELSTLKLNAPQTDTGLTVLQALKERRSVRSYADKPLSLQKLSNLLWAADGISAEDGKRTAPSANNAQEFDIYVVREDGVYVYAPKSHELVPVAAGDYRRNTGMQAYVATAPVNLIYVADLNKIKQSQDEAAKMKVAYQDVGFIAENVALYAASAGLGSVPRGSVDAGKLAPILKLRPEQRIILGQTVGYPQ